MYVDKERERAYWRFAEMKRRCSPRAQPGDLKLYFERGIRVCERWQGRGGFRAFVEDVGLPPFAGAEIDRIDGNKGYEPGNVRWVDHATQTANRRRSARSLSVADEMALVRAIQHGASRASQARRYGITPQTVARIYNRRQM